MTPAITARDYENLIDGKWAAAADGDTFERISPAHDVPVGRYPRAGVEDLERAVGGAQPAAPGGAQQPGAQPAAPKSDLARRRDELAHEFTELQWEIGRAHV